VVDTPVGRLGVAISYEVFFRERGRSPVREGAVLLLVPTNAASFSTSQVPTQEVAAAQLRALSHGRWLVQAAPTGYGAFVDPYGRVRARTVLGEQDVIVMQVATRTGRTPYTVAGDYPAFLLALALLTLPRLRPYLPFWRQ
jgi:apolipoprotein N-acyltransferase